MRLKYSLCVVSFLLFSWTQAQNKASVYGKVVEKSNDEVISFANISLLDAQDSFVEGGITDENGKFEFKSVSEGTYTLLIEYMSFETHREELVVGRLNQNYNLGIIEISSNEEVLDEVVVTGRKDGIVTRMDKKAYTLDENISQIGGSVVQAMQNLPGITTDSEGRINLRGSNRVAILMDGKQSAITGFGVQDNLDNIPASAIERIEIINNPSSKYDSNANAGIINIIMKKEQSSGWNGKVGITTGVGSIGRKRDNLIKNMRSQYQYTPKLNPNFSVNYKKDKFNFFASGDVLLFQEVSQNEFTNRNFGVNNQDNITQQFLENKNQSNSTFRFGADWEANSSNTFTISGFYFRKQYNDLGSIPYLNTSTNETVRFWDYDERELVSIYTLELKHLYQFEEPGHQLETNANLSFKRKEEDYFLTDERPNRFGSDTTALVADQQILDLGIDYTKPFKKGRYELGAKGRLSKYPNDIIFNPGVNSILDLSLQGTAEYREEIAAVYGNLIYETDAVEIESGLRTEYAAIDYLVDPNHPVYESDGFDYFEFLPSLRSTWFVDSKNTLSAFFNRRIDRPEEKNLRVFPSYADPEILSIGNPSLLPQFTNSYEVSYKRNFDKANLFFAVYYKDFENLLTKIATQIPDSNVFVNVDQNASRGSNVGFEGSFNLDITSKIKTNLNINYYQNIINAFQITNAYPENFNFSQDKQQIFTGNIKWNLQMDLGKGYNWQSTATYLDRDIIPQGIIKERFSFDAGLRKELQNGNGEIFLNASDIFNTFRLKTRISDSNFNLDAIDYFETQVVGIGYLYRF